MRPFGFASYTDIRGIVGGVTKTQIARLNEGIDVVVATRRFLEFYLKGALITRKIHAMVLDEGTE